MGSLESILSRQWNRGGTGVGEKEGGVGGNSFQRHFVTLYPPQKPQRSGPVLDYASVFFWNTTRVLPRRVTVFCTHRRITWYESNETVESTLKVPPYPGKMAYEMNFHLSPPSPPQLRRNKTGITHGGGFCAMHGRNVVSAGSLEVSLRNRNGGQSRPKRDAWPMVKWLRQAISEYPLSRSV